MKLLMLAGTSDARRIVEGLVKAGIPCLASLAGVTRHPAPLPCETRIGGFGGADGFRAVLVAQKITGVIDATHPFAHVMSATAAQVCRALDLPHIQVLRPEWRPEPGDRWTSLANEAEAAQHIPQGARVFLATGRQTLDSFANMTGRHLICRQIDPPTGPFPFANGEFLLGRPPFSQKYEEALFRKLAIDWLVVKNSGAEASRSKLDAARALGLPVAMIRRPPQPDCARVVTAGAALIWAREQAMLHA